MTEVVTEEAQPGPAWRMAVRSTNLLPEEGATWGFRLHGLVAVAAEWAPPTGLDPGLSPWPRGADRGGVRARPQAWRAEFQALPVEIVGSK